MSGILINPRAQDEIINFMIAEAKKRKFAGWQFDFENINHLDRDMYSDFVAKTYPKMKENNLEFSVAVIVRSNDYDPNSKNQDWSSAFDYKKLAQNSDFLSLMTYDDPNSEGPVASLEYVNRILNYMEKQAPANKLSLGIPLYCWKWQDGKRAGATTYRLAEKEYRKYKKDRERGYSEKYGAEYFKFTKKGSQTTVWCDSVKSFETKLNIIDSRGLRGFSAWALGQEDSEIWDLLEDRKTE
jgi:spore germination protein YaaH